MPAAENIAKGRNIVVGVDGTDHSMQAMSRIVGVIEALGANAVVIFVRHMPVAAIEPEMAGAMEEMLESIDDVEHDVRAAVEAAFAPTDITWSFEVRGGDPGDELIAAAHAHDAACLVVGATTHGAISSLLLSSVAERLLHHCDVTLLVVRPAPEE